MKPIYSILVLFLLFFCNNEIAAKVNDTIPSVYETEVIVPIDPDKKVVESFTKDKDYDYYDFKPKGKNFIEIIMEQLGKWLRNINPKLSKKETNITSWVIVGAVVIGIILLVILFKPSIFYSNKKNKLAYQVSDEDISGINFTKLIKEALDSEEYSIAIRWKYLQTLKLMQDKELVSWNVNKTVIEYVRELKRKDLKPDFNTLSQLFLYVRYGNFDTVSEDFERVEELSNTIIKRL